MIKKPLEGKKTKRGLWDKRRESAGRGGEKPFPAPRLQGLPGDACPKSTRTWRTDPLAEKGRFSSDERVEDAEGDFQGREGTLKPDADYRRPSGCCQGNL